jgi:hypothetical protein
VCLERLRLRYAYRIISRNWFFQVGYPGVFYLPANYSGQAKSTRSHTTTGIRYQDVTTTTPREAAFNAFLRLFVIIVTMPRAALAQVDSNRVTKVKRPGPTPKPLANRQVKTLRQISRVERSYSRSKKIEVLTFILHHRVFDLTSFKSRDGYRPPSVHEASRFFKIPVQTIRNWIKAQDTIISGKLPTFLPHWPDLEERLFAMILDVRANRRRVTTGLCRRKARALFQELYPDNPTLFTFSSGWWHGFLRRYGISRRRITKVSSIVPSDALAFINSFLRFIRRVSNIGRSTALDPILHISSPSKRFRRSRIINMDETPIPFEFADGYTYDLKGSKTISIASDRSGWDKRQATLILYIFADGVARLKPKIIFKGTSDGRIFKEEGHLYAPDVTVEYNKTAYNNEDLMKQWICDELDPILEGKDLLLVMDVAAFHKTPGVLEDLRIRNITTALIPPGLTSLLQPLDTSINGPFKGWLREACDRYIDRVDPDGQKVWSTSDKRVMTTWVVSDAMKVLESRDDLVRKAFITTGISINPNGDEDFKIQIKGIENSNISFIGWEQAQDIRIKAEEMLSQLNDEEEFVLDTEEATLPLALATLTNDNLKDLCRARGLKVSGVKKDLIDRIQAYVLSSLSSSSQ